MIKTSCLSIYPYNYVKDVIKEFEQEGPNGLGPYRGMGVYGIVVYDIRIKGKRRIIYIGSSNNIALRLSTQITIIYGHIDVWMIR